MANRMGGSRFGFGRRQRVQARPMTADRGGRPGRGGPRFQMRSWLGWLAAAAGVAVVAFLVGRAGSEVELASPTPSPSQAPLTIIFGAAIDPQSGEAVEPMDRFRDGDQVAYSVRLPAALGIESILVEVTRTDGDSRTVVQRPSKQVIVATSPVIGLHVPAANLLKAWGEGTYTLEMYLPGVARPFATGQFTLVATPVAS